MASKKNSTKPAATKSLLGAEIDTLIATESAKKPKAKKTGTKPAGGSPASKTSEKPAEKATPKPKKIEATDSKSDPSNRVMIFRALKKAGRTGLRRPQLCDAIKMDRLNGQMGVILRGEIDAKRIRAEKREHDGGEATFYVATALGLKHLEAGTVDAWARANKLVRRGRTENSPY